MKWIGTQTIYDNVRFVKGIDIAVSKGLSIGGVDILTDSSGTTTLSNIDALDATTEATIEAAVDTLASLTTAAGLTSIGAAGATTDIAAGDLTMYNAVNNGNPTISLGSSATERGEIKAVYESGAQGLNGFRFTTYTASSSTDDGVFGFYVDESFKFGINDDGINIVASGNLSIGGVDILTDSSGTATLSNIDALDATTLATIGTGPLPGLIIDGNKSVTPRDGAMIHVDASTITDSNTSASGTAAIFPVVAIESMSLAATNASVTATAAASLYIASAPSAGTNMTLTNTYAIWVDSGNVKFDGDLTVDGTITGDVTGNVTGNCNGTAATVTAAAQPAIESIGTDGDTLQILGDTLLMSNTSSSKPLISLLNKTDDTAGSVFKFVKQRTDSSTQAGEDLDLLGSMQFYGYNDAGTPELINYARIDTYIHDATDGQESGQLTFQVANHDGGLGNGLILTGGSVNNEIDVALGLGASSNTNVSGNISMGGHCNINASHNYTIDDTVIIGDSSGTATLYNIDALDATTEATIEAAIETRLHYPFRGYCLGISSGNFQFAEDMTDNQFPVQLNSDYGDTVIANGSLDDVSTWFRSSGTVMPRACTAIDMVGWASCPGTGEVTISLCKITPGRDATAAEVPIVVATTTFTALNSNDKLEDFSVGDSGGDGTVTIVTSAIAKGDILMPFVLSPNTKTTYFNMTLEVTG